MTEHRRAIGPECPTRGRGCRVWLARAGLFLAAAAILAGAVLVMPMPAQAQSDPPRGVVEVAPPSNSPGEVLKVQFSTVTILDDADPHGSGEWRLNLGAQTRVPGCESRGVFVGIGRGPIGGKCVVEADTRRIDLPVAKEGTWYLNVTLPDGRTDNLVGFPVRRSVNMILDVFAWGEEDDGLFEGDDYLGPIKRSHWENAGGGWGTDTTHTLRTRHFRIHYTIHRLAPVWPR